MLSFHAKATHREECLSFIHIIIKAFHLLTLNKVNRTHKVWKVKNGSGSWKEAHCLFSIRDESNSDGKLHDVSYELKCVHVLSYSYLVAHIPQLPQKKMVIWKNEKWCKTKQKPCEYLHSVPQCKAKRMNSPRNRVSFISFQCLHCSINIYTISLLCGYWTTTVSTICKRPWPHLSLILSLSIRTVYISRCVYKCLHHIQMDDSVFKTFFFV